MAPALTREQVATAQQDGDFAIKSEKATPQLDTSQWPLLLRNYDKLLVRSSHFTPIPSGSSPLKRDITSYIKYVFMIHLHQFVFYNKNIGLVLSILINLPILHHTKSLLGSDASFGWRKQATVERLIQKSLVVSSFVLTAQRG